jgi:hypothetical protein
MMNQLPYASNFFTTYGSIIASGSNVFGHFFIRNAVYDHGFMPITRYHQLARGILGMIVQPANRTVFKRVYVNDLDQGQRSHLIQSDDPFGLSSNHYLTLNY